MKQSYNNGMGWRLRLAREELGLSREKFAEQLQISSGYLAEVENGKKSMSSLTLSRACTALSLSADYLMFGREEKSDTSVIVDMLSNLDQEYVQLAEDMLRSFVFAVGKARL